MQPYVARIYFDAKAKDGSDSYFEILKNDKRVYLQKARRKGEKFFIGTMYKDDPDAALVKMGMDITGDGQPDLVISEWLGGANCCLVFHIFEIGPTFKKLGTIDAAFGDSGPHFLHPDKDSKNHRADDSDSRLDLCQLEHRFRRLARAQSHPALQRQRISHVARPDARSDAHGQRPCSARRRGQRTTRLAPRAVRGLTPKSRRSYGATMLDLIYSGHADDAWKFLDTRVAAEGRRQRCLRARLSRATRQEPLLARGQGDEFRKASRQTDSPPTVAPRRSSSRTPSSHRP